MEREEGWYWVKGRGIWEVAEFSRFSGFYLAGNEYSYEESDFDQIGPRITPPDESADTELLEALTGIIGSFGDPEMFPHHAHSISGVWDDDNGEKAGTACDACAKWKKARAAIAKATGETK